MLTVITGPMFSGKSSKLISAGLSHVVAGDTVVAFKPANDDRFSIKNICTHNQEKFPAIPLSLNNTWPDMVNVVDLYNKQANPIGVFLFDEVQFFNRAAFSLIVSKMLKWSVRIYCSGLAQDSYGAPFGAMPNLLCFADEIIHLKAVCSKCKSIAGATRTFRKIEQKQQTLVGGKDIYEPRCFNCWSEK